MTAGHRVARRWIAAATACLAVLAGGCEIGRAHV